MDRQMDRWLDGQLDNKQMDSWIDRQMDRWIEQKDSWIDGQMVRYIDKLINGQMDRKIDQQLAYPVGSLHTNQHHGIYIYRQTDRERTGIKE